VFHYGVYGVELVSDIPLALPPSSDTPLARIALRRAEPAAFAAAAAVAQPSPESAWFASADLEDGSIYVRWEGLGEFIAAADGGSILCARTPGAHDESFQVYLLGQALSYALVKAGFEPIHGTVLVHDGRGVTLLGDSGYGKSTLAACMLAAGARLLTDDLLMVRPAGAGYIAYPGPARIKLLPDSAARFLPDAAKGVPMNPLTSKMIIPLGADRTEPGPTPLAGIYVLPSPLDTDRRRRIRLHALSSRDAFVALVANTFNRRLTDPGRMGRQHAQTAALSRAVPVVAVGYPRGIDHVEALAEAILAHAGTAARAA
jgi:hypothetical protein